MQLNSGFLVNEMYITYTPFCLIILVHHRLPDQDIGYMADVEVDRGCLRLLDT